MTIETYCVGCKKNTAKKKKKKILVLEELNKIV